MPWLWVARHGTRCWSRHYDGSVGLSHNTSLVRTIAVFFLFFSFSFFFSLSLSPLPPPPPPFSRFALFTCLRTVCSNILEIFLILCVQRAAFSCCVMMCCVVLRCTVLCCVEPCCDVLRCFVFYCNLYLFCCIALRLLTESVSTWWKRPLRAMATSISESTLQAQWIRRCSTQYRQMRGAQRWWLRTLTPFPSGPATTSHSFSTSWMKPIFR